MCFGWFLQQSVTAGTGVEATIGTSAFGDNISLRASVRLEGVGVSVIDAHPRELLYITAGDIAFDYAREDQVLQY